MGRFSNDYDYYDGYDDALMYNFMTECFSRAWDR